MIDVLIVYEHKVREMESVLLLKYVLEKKGYTVEITQIEQKYKWTYIINKRPRLVLSPFLYNDFDIKKYIYICGKIEKMINFQWEQVFNEAADDHSKQTPVGNAKEAIHICWGRKSYDRLVNDGIRTAKLIGAPQFDFLKKGFEKWYSTKQEVVKNYGLPNKKIILFISSLSYVGLSEEKLSYYEKLCDFDVYNFKQLCEKTQVIVIEWFERFLRENPDYIIVYRPHPAEQLSDVVCDEQKKNKSFYVIREESVKQWIKISDVILNWFSSSGPEVVLSGKKNVFVRPYEFSQGLDYAMYKNAIIVNNYDDMSNEIISYGKNQIDPSYELLNEYYLLDKHLVYPRLVDVVSEILESDTKSFEGFTYSKISIILHKTFSCICMGMYMISKMLRAKKVKNKLEKFLNVNEYITSREIEKFNDKIKKILGEN